MPAPILKNPTIGRAAVLNYYYDATNDQWVAQAGGASGGTATDRSATVGTSSSQLMPANAGRSRLFIANDTGSDVYIRLGSTAAASSAGNGNIKIASSGKLELNGITSAVQIIGTAANLNVTAYEW